MSPSGDALVVAAWDAILVYAFRAREGRWEQVSSNQVPNMYAGTALAFRPDGSGVVVGTVTGCVDVYESMLRKVKYVGTDATGVSREVLLTYTSKSSVRLRDAQTGASMSGERGEGEGRPGRSCWWGAHCASDVSSRVARQRAHRRDGGRVTSPGRRRRGLTIDELARRALGCRGAQWGRPTGTRSRTSRWSRGSS